MPKNTNLLTQIRNTVRTNGSGAITGANLQTVLTSIVNTVGAGATFMGIATPQTTFATLDGNAFYIAMQAGTYKVSGGEDFAGGLLLITNISGSWAATDLGVRPSSKLIGSDDIADGAIKTKNLGAGQVNANALGVDSVTERSLRDENVTTPKIADKAITQQKIADEAVGNAQVANGAITSAKIAALSVLTDKLAANAVTEGKIAGSAVTEGKIAGSAVTEGKIAGSAVTTTKIANRAVTAEKLDPSIPLGKVFIETAITYNFVNLGDSAQLTCDASRYTAIGEAIDNGTIGGLKLNINGGNIIAYWTPTARGKSFIGVVDMAIQGITLIELIYLGASNRFTAIYVRAEFVK